MSEWQDISAGRKVLQREFNELSDKVAEFRQLRYAANCKCGQCSAVPLAVIDEVVGALRTSAYLAVAPLPPPPNPHSEKVE